MIYLYVKQHSITKLKYFGKTTSSNPFKYNGSGKYWTKHIKKHKPKHIQTLEIWGFDNQELCTEFALKFSKDNNIVEEKINGKKTWANLKDENGLDGNPEGLWKGMTHVEIFGENTANKIKNAVILSNKTRIISDKTKSKMSNTAKQRLKDPKNNSMFGKTHTVEARKKIALSSRGRKWSEESKNKIRNKRGPRGSYKEYTCPHCNKIGKGGNMKRYHFDNCSSFL